MLIQAGYDPELKAFKELVKSGSADAAKVLRKGFVIEVKADDTAAADDRTLKFTISTGSVDRDGDTLAVLGWKLANYAKNPVVLWAHNASLPPVAKAPSLTIEGGALKALAEFMPADMSQFADSIFRMYKGGFLNAVSVGFLPLKYVPADRPDAGWMPMDFLEQELMEFSCVPVPANPEALQEAKHKAGIDISPLATWAESILDTQHGNGLWVPRATLETVYAEAKSLGKVFSIPGFTPATVKGATDEPTATPAVPATEQASVPAATSEAPAAAEAKQDEPVDAERPATAVVKRGRVLSSKNEKMVRDAHGLLNAVLDQLQKDDDVVEDDGDDDKSVITITEKQSDSQIILRIVDAPK